MLGRVSIFIIFIVLLAFSGAWGAPLVPVPEELRLKADRLSHGRDDDRIQADGNVELVWNGTRLYADMATYLQGEGVVSATGNVRVLKGDDILTGDSVKMNIDDRTGRIENGYMFVRKNNLHMHAAEIEKTGDLDFRMHRGSITTCDGDRPGWKFLVDDLKISANELASGRNAYFYLGEIPVFWLPYIVFPVVTERQSGFFFPSLGNSSKKGVFIDIPYYWAISPSSDATFDLDLQSKRGVGVGMDHRYLGRDEGRGSNRAYLIFDTNRDRFRGELQLKQQVNFSSDTYWRADANLTLDRDYFRDYGQNSGEYNRQFLGTTAFISHKSDSLVVTGGVDYINDLEASDNRSTLQKLPYVTFIGSGSRIGESRFSYSFDSSLVQLERETGGTGQRLTLAPRLDYGRPFGELLTAGLWGGYEQRVYHATESSGEGGWQGIGAALGGAYLRTELARVYRLSPDGTAALRHLVVPELAYGFRENSGNDGIPFFDFDDRPASGQHLTLSLRNIFTNKSVSGDRTDYRDLMRFTLSQGYQLSGNRRDLLVLFDEGRPFADTRLKAEILPYPLLRLATDLRVSPYSGTLTNASLGLEGGEAKGDRIGLSWHHVYDRLDYLQGKLTLVDLKPITLSAMGRYSFDKPGFLETLYSVDYRRQCWSFNLTYRERPDNKELSFNFTLEGLGPIGPLKAF